MSAITLSDKLWLRNNQPGLFVVETAREDIIKGVLKFRGKDDSSHIEIEDEYNLRLLVRDDGTPIAHETSGRLNAKLAENPELSQADVHMYRGGRLCLAAPQQLTLNYLPNRNIEKLFRTYLVPYFFSQSYHEVLGEWPWPHLDHGAKGLVQWFLDNHDLKGAATETVKELKRIADKKNEAAKLIERGSRFDSFIPNSQCLCGSRTKSIYCHPELMKLAFAIRYAN